MTRKIRRIAGNRAVTRSGAVARTVEDTSIKVKCAFCEGTGKDPFGCMSHLSNCQVCSGRGVVRVQPPVVECAFCEGTGIQPHSPHRLTCSACGGKGVVTAIGDSITCPTCEGSGITMAPLPVACLTCNGQGVIRRRD